MYLFSAIKDALFSNRRTSVSGQASRYSEPGMRRSSGEGFLLPQFSPTESERDGPLGSKAKRSEPERVISVDQEPKRRRTTVGGESERISARLSIDRSDAPSLGSRSRLPSPLPRSSAAGPGYGRRNSLLGSPMSMGTVSRLGGSPRASPRPHTPVNPKFVDLLRRDPSQQRALDSARSILDTLDRVTSGPYGGIGGSARKYRPPQPLRPMRFKSLSTASRPVSLHEMLTGAASVQSPSSRPATPRGITLPSVASRQLEEIPKQSIQIGESPKHRLLPLQTGSSPRQALVQPRAASPMNKAEIPARPASPMNKPTLSPRPASPMNKPIPPPKGTFIWGDPTKVSDADFIEEDGFAPGADSSGSEVEEAPRSSTDVKSIFGKPKSTGTSSLGSIFGGVTADNNDTFGPSSKSIFDTKPTEFSVPASGSSSLFGSQQAKTKTDPTEPSVSGESKPVSIFGAQQDQAKSKPTEPRSIFGDAKAPIESSTSIFGAQQDQNKTKPTEPTIFGGAKAVVESTGSIFGASAGKQPETSVFGGSKPVVESTGSIFGSQEQKKKLESSVFGGESSIFGSKSEQPSVSIFGNQPSPTQTSAGIFGSIAKPAEPSSSSSIFGGVEAKPVSTAASGNVASIFGQGSTGSIFGQVEKKPETPSAASAGMFVFGATPPASPHPQTQQANIFGGSGTPSSIFGQASNNPNSGFPFGVSGAPQPSTPAGGSLFGAPAPGTPSGGLFGASAAPAPIGNSIFGSSTDQSSSAFTFAASSGTPTSAAAAGGMFGGVDNPFAAGDSDEFKNSSKRKILKARRT